MLIRIPETPGIPAVLREIAALCPRHSSTAEQHSYSLSSSRASASQPTDRPTRACENACARVCTRYISRTRDEQGASRMVTLTLVHTFSFPASVCPSTATPRRCPICCCRLFEVERSTDRGLRYIGLPCTASRVRLS